MTCAGLPRSVVPSLNWTVPVALGVTIATGITKPPSPKGSGIWITLSPVVVGVAPDPDVGVGVGAEVGAGVGCSVGAGVGCSVGVGVGVGVGAGVGCPVGVGVAVGEDVGVVLGRPW